MLYLYLAVAFVATYVSAFNMGGRTVVQPKLWVDINPSLSFHNFIHRSNGARSMTMMPIGVPKVAYRMPGNRGGEWVDIFNRLTRERIVFMGSEIDDELANQIIGVLLVCLPIEFV